MHCSSVGKPPRIRRDLGIIHAWFALERHWSTYTEACESSSRINCILPAPVLIQTLLYNSTITRRAVAATNVAKDSGTKGGLTFSGEAASGVEYNNQ